MADLLPEASLRDRVQLALTYVTLIALGLGAGVTTDWAARSGLGNGVVIPLGGISALALLFLVLGGYRLLGSRRDASVVRRLTTTEGLVFASGRTRDFRTAVAPYRLGDRSLAIPYDFTVVCDEEGVTFWAGSIADPVPFARVPWGRISRAAVDRVRIDQRQSRGLVVISMDGSRLELQPLGHGLLATFPLSKETLTRAAARVNSLASAARSTASHPDQPAAGD